MAHRWRRGQEEALTVFQSSESPHDLIDALRMHMPPAADDAALARVRTIALRSFAAKRTRQHAHGWRIAGGIALAFVLVATLATGKPVVTPVGATPPEPDQASIRFTGIDRPFESLWREVPSVVDAMSVLESAESQARSVLAPVLTPRRAFIAVAGEAAVMFEYAEATMTISPKSENDVRAGYASQMPGADERLVVREFEGHPAFGVEKDTTVGDPADRSKPWSHASTTSLVWTTDGFEYALQSDVLGLDELQAFARRVLAL